MTPYHCSLLVEGGGLAICQFRDNFTAVEFAADSNAVYRDRVGEGNAMMYSFRTADAPSIEQFWLFAEHWPALKFSLVYDCIGPDGFVGFAIAENGRMVGYWGTAVACGGRRHGIAAISNDHDHCRRHCLSTEQFEKRLRASGIWPDDPIEPPDHSDAADW